MQPVSVVGLFCEDIREEKSEQDTLIGLLPDNLQLMIPQVALGKSVAYPKLALYVRIHLDANNAKPQSASVKIVNTDGKVVVKGEWQPTVIDKAFKDAKQNQMSIVGLVQKMVAAPFPFPQPGKVQAIAEIDGIEYLAAVLNVVIPNATASPPPVLQSPSDAPPSS